MARTRSVTRPSSSPTIVGFPVDKFAVRQHWHAKYHHEAGNRWLRSVVADLFLSRTSS
jgi:hypothetical protein